MDFDDRIWFLLLGCLIGFVVGYIVASLRAIKEEVHEVDMIVRQNSKPEEGKITTSLVQNVALGFVVLVVAVAAFVSQGASNDVKETQGSLADTQSRLSRVSICTQQYLSKTIVALNERTTYSVEQARANVELQRAQAEFLQVFVVVPPATDDVRREALTKYFDRLTKFVAVSGKTANKQAQNPYPTNDELMSCIEDGPMFSTGSNP